MLTIRTAGDAIQGHSKAVTKAVQEAVRQLLEKKHLYQSIEVDVQQASEAFQKRVPQNLSHTLSFMKGADLWPWVVHDTDSFQAMVSNLTQQPDRPTITWQLPDAKLFCKTCDRLEPFNGLAGSNVLNRSSPSAGGVYHKGKLNQVYSLSYLCQSCKGLPEVFLVRRQGTRISLSGRSPIEHVQVPKSIPREVAAYYSDALVAYQSGQVLAALFMLRTICEQWTRRFADAGDRADAALDKYMDGLPADFKARFPSLRTIYGDLSLALHSADASSDLFESSRTSIEEHFAARELFKL